MRRCPRRAASGSRRRSRPINSAVGPAGTFKACTAPVVALPGEPPDRRRLRRVSTGGRRPRRARGRGACRRSTGAPVGAHSEDERDDGDDEGGESAHRGHVVGPAGIKPAPRHGPAFAMRSPRSSRRADEPIFLLPLGVRGPRGQEPFLEHARPRQDDSGLSAQRPPTSVRRFALRDQEGPHLTAGVASRWRYRRTWPRPSRSWGSSFLAVRDLTSATQKNSPSHQDRS
jgi:hypothetical protein